jgi:hypothetical protein
VAKSPRLRGGARFETAFEDVTGLTPENMENEFWRRQNMVNVGPNHWVIDSTLAGRIRVQQK